MCLKNTRESNIDGEINGYKVFIQRDNGSLHSIKKEFDNHNYQVGNFYSIEEYGFFVFYDKDDAGKFASFVDKLNNGKNDGKLVDGKAVIKQVKCNNVIVEGYQGLNTKEVVTKVDKPANAFRCLSIKIL